MHESFATKIMETRSRQSKAGPSWNISNIIDAVFHDEDTEEINNLQGEDCGWWSTEPWFSLAVWPNSETEQFGRT